MMWPFKPQPCLAPKLSDNEKRRLLTFQEVFFQSALSARQNNMAIFGEGADLLAKMTDEDIAGFIELKRLNQKGVAATKSGDFRGAIDYFGDACERAPFDSISMMSVGVAYAYLGDGSNALRYLEKALAIDPANERIKTNLNAVRTKMGLY